MPPGIKMFQNEDGTFFWEDPSGFQSFYRSTKKDCRASAWYTYDRMQEEAPYPRLIEVGK